MDVLFLAFLIGGIAGLRSLTAPAVVAWGAHRHWLGLESTFFSLMGSTAGVVVLTTMALGELVADKLPFTPNRTEPIGLIARMGFGGLCGAAVAASGSQLVLLGVVAGVAGGLTGAFAGYEARKRLVRALGVRDLVIACLEDAVAIGGGLLIVWTS